MSQSYILTFFAPDNLLINGGWQAYHLALWGKGMFLYIGSQLERSPSTNRLHWQAFVKFKRENKQKKTWFHNNGLLGVHAEVCSVERAEAINYGIKADTRVEGPLESGEKPVPKSASKKFEECKEAILENRKQDVPFQMVLQFRLEQRWESLREFYKEDKRESLPMVLPNPWGKLLFSSIKDKKRHYWIFSRQPNLGKTFYFAKPLERKYKVCLENGDFSYWTVESDTECVILDEYNTAKLNWSSLNAMCDGTFKYRKIYKGKVSCHDPLIVILSNQSISELYPNTNVFLYARFNEIELV